MKLEQYFRDNYQNQTIDYRVRCIINGDETIFYIHPDSKDGITLDYQVEGDKLTLLGMPSNALLDDIESQEDYPEFLREKLRQKDEQIASLQQKIQTLENTHPCEIHGEGLFLYSKPDGNPTSERILTIKDWNNLHDRLQELYAPYVFYSKSELLSVINSIVRDSKDKEQKVLAKAKIFQDDVLSWMRAIAINCDSVANAFTHKEKDARLRGVISVIETAISRIREDQGKILTNYWSDYPDIFRSDYPVRKYVQRIKELEYQLEQLKEGKEPDPMPFFGSDEF